MNVCARLAFLYLWVAGRIASAALPESSPLPLRPDASRPLFQTISPGDSGVDIVHRFPTNAPLVLMQEQGAGAGICVGDLDGDGLPDLFCSGYNQGCRLYRNLGNWRFADVTDRAGVRAAGRWCGGVTVVDIDNDGDLDLYVCCLNSPNLLFINRGDGTFVERANEFGIGWNGANVMAAFGDFDRDGRLDLYLLTHRDSFDPRQRLPSGTADAGRRGIVKRGRAGKIEIAPTFQDLFALLDKGDDRIELSIAGQADLLFRQNSDGTFTNVTIPAGIRGHDIGLGVSWWDFDGDGWPDIYVANDHKTPDRLWRNNRDGTFTDVAASALPQTPLSSMGTDVADVNNDGRLDLFATDMAGSTHARRMQIDGDSERHRWFLERAQPRQLPRNALYLGLGGPRVLEAARLAGIAATDWTWSPKWGDFDNDGWVDLFIANGMSRDYLNGDLLARVAKPGAPGWRLQPVLKERHLAFRNRGDLQFERIESAWGLDQKSASFGAAMADLDRDGDLDLVVMNLGESVSLHRNNESTNHRVIIRLLGGPSNRYGVGALVTATTSHGLVTRTVSLTSGFMSANEPIIHLGLGSDIRISHLTVEWPTGGRQTFDDLPADRTYTIREEGLTPSVPPSIIAPAPTWFSSVSPDSEFTHRELNFDDFERDPLLPWKLSKSGPGLAVGDIDGDGLDDFLLSGGGGQPGMLARVRADGRRERIRVAGFELDSNSDDRGAVFFDADGDNAADLYVVSGGVQSDAGDPVLQDRLYRNDGRGNFSRSAPGALPSEHDSGSAVCAVDFDRDGDLDLFVGGHSIPGRYPLPARSHLLRNHHGTFTDVTQTLAPGMGDLGVVTGATWSDVNGDGWPDLLITQEWGSVRLFLNRNGTLTDSSAESGFASHRGLWQGIVAADVDGDGDFDCITANFGLNSSLRAASGAPHVLYRGEFSGAGQDSLFQAQFEDGQLRSTRTRSILLAALPGFADVLPTFDSLAAAGLTNLFSPSILASAYRVDVDTLESGVWINDGSAHFSFRPLPRLVQLAPTWGLAATDFDGDGHIDLCLAQNFRGTPAEMGPMNGSMGLVLGGRGDGGFTPVNPYESGWQIPEDARSMAVTDLNHDGWPDLLVGINNGPVAAFINQAALHRPTVVPLTIRLRGGLGNPTAVGARIEVRFSDGSRSVSEVNAGNGYLSQSSAVQFVPHSASRIPREIRVRWPDGGVTSTNRIEARDMVMIEPARRK